MKIELTATCKQVHGTTRKVLLNNHVCLTIDHLENFNVPLEKGVKYKVMIEPVKQ